MTGGVLGTRWSTEAKDRLSQFKSKELLDYKARNGLTWNSMGEHFDVDPNTLRRWARKKHIPMRGRAVEIGRIIKRALND